MTLGKFLISPRETAIIANATWFKFSIFSGSVTFLVAVCLQEASLLEQVLPLFLPIQIGFIPLSFYKTVLNLL